MAKNGFQKNNFLTIGIPIFNGGEFIERISNIKRVTKVDYHIIILIIALMIIQKLYKTDLRRNKNISYFRQKKNIGVVDNFKFLLKKSLSNIFFCIC